jgi:hypothetical protein
MRKRVSGTIDDKVEQAYRIEVLRQQQIAEKKGLPVPTQSDVLQMVLRFGIKSLQHGELYVNA